LIGRSEVRDRKWAPLGKGYSLYANSLKSRLSGIILFLGTPHVASKLFLYRCMSSTCITHPGPSFKQLQRWQGIRAENRAKRLGCAHEGCLTSNSYACQNLAIFILIQPLYLIVDKALWPIGALLSAFFTYLVCSPVSWHGLWRVSVSACLKVLLKGKLTPSYMATAALINQQLPSCTNVTVLCSHSS
jgi:hypothetical protein